MTAVTVTDLAQHVHTNFMPATSTSQNFTAAKTLTLHFAIKVMPVHDTGSNSLEPNHGDRHAPNQHTHTRPMCLLFIHAAMTFGPRKQSRSTKRKKPCLPRGQVSPHLPRSSWRWFGEDTPPGSEEEKEIWVRQINGETVSNECMPISVTRGGKQTSNYFVVADPSEDEITLFDASSLSSGPLDSYRAANPLANITDIVVEGRGGDELNDNYAFVVMLWENIEEEKQLEHIPVMDGDIDDHGPFLLEDLPETTSGVNAVSVIGTRGAEADYAQDSLFILGDRVVNRVYHR